MILVQSTYRRDLTSGEWAVFCFSIGVGLWHVVMFVLGLFNLYYRGVALGLALVVLLASARHFAEVFCVAQRALLNFIKSGREGKISANATCAGLISIGLVWVLLTRGLYPGGGGDYYTHYFYYYLDVLKHHGLAPNDVWYHYYYSKGYGLFFLSMLLTDPEFSGACYILLCRICCDRNRDARRPYGPRLPLARHERTAVSLILYGKLRTIRWRRFSKRPRVGLGFDRPVCVGSQHGDACVAAGSTRVERNEWNCRIYYLSASWHFARLLRRPFVCMGFGEAPLG